MVPVTDKTYCLPVKHHLHPPPPLPRPLSSHTLSLPPLEVMDRVLLILDCYTVRAHELEPKFTYIKQISVEIQPPELVSRHRGAPRRRPAQDAANYGHKSYRFSKKKRGEGK